jgi:hypothetical protein
MTYVIGIDPGPMVGIVGINADWVRLFDHEPLVIQCSAHVFDDVLSAIATGHGDTVLAVERFVTASISARVNAPAASRVARAAVQRCEDYAAEHQLQCFVRSAAEVKPWATNERLTRAGLIAATKGMHHARDAARHALFTAVHDCGLRDPLSKAAHR